MARGGGAGPDPGHGAAREGARARPRDAYRLAPLLTPHGAPLRPRVERKPGRKHASFVRLAEAAASLARLGGGRCLGWEGSAAANGAPASHQAPAASP